MQRIPSAIEEALEKFIAAAKISYHKHVLHSKNKELLSTHKINTNIS